jgi:polyhydroxyalkanoate synthesis regulator phasin
MANPNIKSYLEAGLQFTEMSKKQAEVLVKSLVKSGEVKRKDAEKLAQEFVDRSRETAEHLAAVVQIEVAKQMAALSARLDELERSLKGSSPAPAKKAPAKKAPAKNAPAKKKAAAEPVGSSGVRKVSTTRKA